MIHPFFQRPLWSSSPCCPCRPWCRQLPTHMYLMLSDMLKVKRNLHVNHNRRSMSHQVEKIPTEVIHPICHWPSWFPSPCRPCHPQCRRPPAHMYLMLSNMLKLSWTFMSTTITTAYHILVEETPTEVIHPNASDLPGLLLLVVLAVHGVVDHQTTRAESRQVGYPRKGFSMENKVLQSLSVG